MLTTSSFSLTFYFKALTRKRFDRLFLYFSHLFTGTRRKKWFSFFPLIWMPEYYCGSFKLELYRNISRQQKSTKIFHSHVETLQKHAILGSVTFFPTENNKNEIAPNKQTYATVSKLNDRFYEVKQLIRKIVLFVERLIYSTQLHWDHIRYDYLHIPIKSYMIFSPHHIRWN